LNNICKIFFNNNQSIRNKLFNYIPSSKINISYFYWTDKAYKNIKKKNKDLINIEDIENEKE